MVQDADGKVITAERNIYKSEYSQFLNIIFTATTKTTCNS